MKATVLFSLALLAVAHLAIADENEIDQDVLVPEIPLQADPSLANPDMTISTVEQMYRSTMVSVLKQKVLEVQRKVVKGENALPDAIDILKIALLSQPTNNVTIRKAAENVLSRISPQLGKAASVLTGHLLDDPTKEAQKAE